MLPFYRPFPAMLRMFAALVLILSVRADEPEFMRPNVTASADGAFFFKSILAVIGKQQDQPTLTREAFGVAYSIGENGSFQETWRTSGWHTNHGYLSRDGRYFVRMGPWASNINELAIAFYDQGKLLKEYQIKDLVRDAKAIEHSISHLSWRPEVQSVPNGFLESGFSELGFHLVAIDKSAYRFDAKTGAIHERTVDTGAKSSGEIFIEGARKAGRKGKLLFESSSFKTAFEAHFEISKMAEGWPPNGVFLEGRAWMADLKPKATFSIPCLIEATFPISASSHQIEATLTPSELEDSFRAALAHPYIAEMRSKEKTTKLRLRPVGDRLHWDHTGLTGLLARAPGITNPEAEPLRDWAEFILDCEPREYRGFYLNIRSGELLREDGLKLVRLDAKGQPLPVKKPLDQ